MYTGITDHKNTLGMICMIFGLGFLWRFFEHYRTKDDPLRRRHLLAHGSVLAMVCWLLWMSNSVTSKSCLAIAAALFAMISVPARGRKVWVVHFLVAVLVILPLFALFADPGGNLVETLGRNSTLTGRTAVWQQVIDMSGNPLVGVGFESFWLGDRLREFWDKNSGSTINEAHNGYLEVYLNLGWCGVMLLSVLIVTGYRNAIAALRRDRHVGGLMLAYLIAAVIYSLSEAGFRMLSPTWIFFLLATAAIPRSSFRRAPNLDEVVTRPEHWASEYEGVV